MFFCLQFSEKGSHLAESHPGPAKIILSRVHMAKAALQGWARSILYMCGALYFPILHSSKEKICQPVEVKIRSAKPNVDKNFEFCWLVFLLTALLTNFWS